MFNWVLSIDEVRRSLSHGGYWTGPTALVLGYVQPHHEVDEDGARLERIHLFQVKQGGHGELLVRALSDVEQDVVREMVAARGLGSAVAFDIGYVVVRPRDATPGMLAA